MSQILNKFDSLSAADAYWQERKREYAPADASDVIERVLVEMDPTYVSTFTALLQVETTITSPKVDNVTRPGTFANSVSVEEGDGTRAVTVVNRLTRVYPVAAATDLMSLTARPARENEILNLFGLEEGEGDRAAFVYENINPTSRDECMALSDADLCKKVLFADSVAAWATATAYVVGDIRKSGTTIYFCITAHTSGTFATDLAAGKWREYGADYATSTGYKANEVVAGSGRFYRWAANDTSATLASDLADGSLVHFWNYATRKFEVMSNGAGRFTIGFAQVAWDKTWASNKRLMVESNGSGLNAGRRYEVDGIPTSKMAAALVTGVTAESNYALAGVALRETGGKLALSAEQVKANGIADAVVYHSFQAAFGRREESETYRWINVTGANADLIVADAKTNKAAMNGAMYSPSPSGHKLGVVQKLEHSGDPLFDVVRMTYKPQGDSDAAITWTASQTRFPVRVPATYPNEGYVHRIRHVCTKYFAGSNGSGAATWISASTGPGADMYLVGGGLMWKAVAVVDDTTDSAMNLTGSTPAY